jgi:hypothetical protein
MHSEMNVGSNKWTKRGDKNTPAKIRLQEMHLRAAVGGEMCQPICPL